MTMSVYCLNIHCPVSCKMTTICLFNPSMEEILIIASPREIFLVVFECQMQSALVITNICLGILKLIPLFDKILFEYKFHPNNNLVFQIKIDFKLKKFAGMSSC